jgi:hypothetical protein
MAVLRNPYTGDDPDPEDDDQIHAPSCQCDICEEERSVWGASSDFILDDSDDLDDDAGIHGPGCTCSRCP